jgi:hypothetical protein
MTSIEIGMLMDRLAQYWPAWAEKVQAKAPALVERWRQAFGPRDYGDSVKALQNVIDSTRYQSPTVRDFTDAYSAVHQQPAGEINSIYPKYSGWWVVGQRPSGMWWGEPILYPNPDAEAKMGAFVEQIARQVATRKTALYGQEYSVCQQTPGNEGKDPCKAWNREQIGSGGELPALPTADAGPAVEMTQAELMAARDKFLGHQPAPAAKE